MRMRLTAPSVLLAVLACVPRCLADPVEFGGMSLAELTTEQLTEVGAAYGEPVGLLVSAVGAGSMAAISDVQVGDVLISVRLPEETDYYPIPPTIDDMAQFAADTAPSTDMRLLILRKVGDDWSQIRCFLGRPPDVAVPDDVIAADGEDDEDQQPPADYAMGSGGFDFISDDSEAVLATTPAGAPLTQRDADIFGGLMAWSFGTRLTEAQKLVVRDSLIEFWQAATPEVVDFFDQGIRAMPGIIPQLTPEQREQIRQSAAGIFIQMAQGMPAHPLGQIIAAVAQAPQQVLAGAGTEMPLTVQDVNALLEYVCFQTQVMTGQPVAVTQETYLQFAQGVVDRYNNGDDEEKRALASMDEQWGMVRAQWAQAAAAQQQALAQQMQQQYLQQYPQDVYMQGLAQGGQWGAGAGMGTGGYGAMSDSTYEVMRNVLDMEHASSMQAISSINLGDEDYDVYDSAGNWLYSY